MLYLIHQPGKVASQTVEQAIRNNVRRWTKVERHHFLSPRGIAEMRAICLLPKPEPRTLESLKYQTAVAEKLCRDLFARKRLRICVITGIRDPLRHAIACFFQNLNLHFPGITHSAVPLSWNVAQLLEYFDRGFRDMREQKQPENMREAIMRRALLGIEYWFRHEFAPFYGFDICDVELEENTPFTKFRRGDCDFLIYRTELLPTHLDELLRNAGVKTKSKIANVNVAAAKECASLYRAFLNVFQPTEDMRDYYYGGKFAQHFFPHARDRLDVRTFPPALAEALRA